MPFDITYTRNESIEAETAFDVNEKLISDFVILFPEFADEVSLLPNLEEPNLHAWLGGEVGDFFFYFSFWANEINLEVAAGDDIDDRFAHIWRYSEYLTEHGFSMTDPETGEKLSLSNGMRASLISYLGWVGFVEKVKRAANPPE